ncbi:response regulator transcription factor [Aciditerrimonas ferrireducens]|uniref:response regulator transcription factor n=1 Tax=Aciditerrimonas ferrireducens TaxID=667306 RepID=UPI002003206E|nr:response regulator transcription factor [Aciditerrimonas ferrireducens]
MARVLVVDDDRALVRTLAIALGARGFDVVTAHSGRDGIAQVALTQPDVVVLDLGLPDLDGVQVCREVRQWSAVPIVVLSAADDEQRKVAALDLGADDYVTKPFGMAELQARLRVALRHGTRQGEGEARVTLGRLVVDQASRCAWVDGELLDLTAKELDLLAYLARHAGKLCPHHLVLQAVWGPGYGTETHYLRTYAHRLRRKLDGSGVVLRTHPGLGYELRLAGEPVTEPAPGRPRSGD